MALRAFFARSLLNSAKSAGWATGQFDDSFNVKTFKTDRPRVLGQPPDFLGSQWLLGKARRFCFGVVARATRSRRLVFWSGGSSHQEPPILFWGGGASHQEPPILLWGGGASHQHRRLLFWSGGSSHGSSHHREAALGILDGSSHHHEEFLMAQAISTKEGCG